MTDRDPATYSVRASLSSEMPPVPRRVVAGTVHGLHQLLGRSSPEWNDPIGKLAKLALNARDADSFASVWEARRLGFLSSDVRLLADRSPGTFKQFRKSYRKLTFNEFFDWRHELRLAAELLKRGIEFQKRESPDFAVVWNGADVFIECGSVNVTRGSDRDLSYKLASAISSKAAKDYASKNTALFLDYSNVLFYSANGTTALDAQLVIDTVKEAMLDCRLGAVHATAVVVDTGSEQLKCIGMPFVAQDATPALAAFIQAYAPALERWLTYVPTFTI